MKFTAGCALFAAVVSAQDWGRGGYDGGFGGFDDSPFRGNGGYGGHGKQRTYGWVKGPGYGIYNFDASRKPLRGNDGYKLKKRTDPHDRNYNDTYAKCVIQDPFEETYVEGLLYLAQASKADSTKIWGSIGGADYGSLTINALGDQSDGCDSLGGVFNPNVSANGTPFNYDKHDGKAPGDLGEIGDGKIEVWADVDLSGSHSIMGRSIVVTVHDDRVACCTIGVTSGPEKPSYSPQRGYGGPGPDRGYGGRGSYGGYGGNW